MKGKVKIIKKNEVKTAELPENIDQQSTKEAAREMVSTVTNWVSDFQQRRREETKQTLEKFFSPQPTTSEL